MHLVSNRNPLAIANGLSLVPGTYLCDDADAANLMANAGGGEVSLVKFFTAENGLKDWQGHNTSTITIVRPGRFGDLLLLTPCLRAIKQLWPNCKLQVACLPQYRDAIIGLPYIDNYLPYPLPFPSPADYLKTYGTIIALEVLTSLVRKEGELHMTDLFGERLGLPFDLATKKPDFLLTMDETNWAHDTYPRDGKKKRVAIQIKSSTPSRDYPMIQMGDVVRRLHGRGWDVLLLGLPHQIEGSNKPNLLNCAKDRLTFRQTAAVLSTADVFLGPDSSMIHVAGALEVPAVGLFSVVPWKLRTAYCPTTFVIQAKSGCDIQPCFHAPRGQMGFPVGGPCIKDRKCSALASIDAHDVVLKVESMAKA